MVRARTPPIISCKVLPPRLPKTIIRPRLFRELDKARTRPVIWLTAPAGMGKTTLIADYLKAKKITPLWYQIDEGDGDPATLFQYLKTAVASRAPRKAAALLNLTPEYLPSLSLFSREFFAALATCLKTPGFLIFDNFQELSVDAPTQKILALCAESLPPSHHLVILSRSEPPPAFARLLANQKISLLDANALTLTLEETIALCRLQGLEKPSETLPKHASRIFSRTKGWIAGTILLLETWRFQEDETFQGLEGQDFLFHYLAKEVLEYVSPDLQRLLIYTAFFPSFTADVAKSITGLKKAPTYLSALYRSRYFIEKSKTSEGAYRYHPLFQKFLQHHVQETLTSNEQASLLQQTASLLEQAGQEEAALELWMKQKAYQEAANIIVTQAPHLTNQGRFNVLQGWIEAIPGDQREKDPWLNYWLGVCWLPFSPKDARPQFEAAFHLFHHLGAQEGLWLAFSGIINAVANEWNNLSPLGPWIDRLPTLLHKAPFLELPEAIQGIAAGAIVQALMWRIPDHPDAEQWLDMVRKKILAIPDPFHRVYLAFNIGNFMAWKGKGKEALTLFEAIRAQDSQSSLTTIPRMLLSTFQKVITWYTGDNHSLRNIQQDQVFAEKTVVLNGIGRSASIACEIYLALQNENISLANHYLQVYQSLVSEYQGGANEIHYFFCAAWIAVCDGKVSHAKLYLQQGLKDSQAMGVPYPETEVGLAMAEIELELGHFDEVEAYLTHYKDMVARINSPMSLMKWWLITARLELSKGRKQEGWRALQTALKISRDHDCTIFSFWRSAPMTALCLEALTHNIEIDQARRLIRKRNLIPLEPPLTIPHWPWAIKISTLGRLAIEIDGQLLQRSRKAQRKPLQLLKCLLALGGKDVSETQLTDLIWPDADGDFAHQNLATTLHRLRKLLKYEEAILVHNKLVSLNPRYCWVDIWAWDSLLALTSASHPVHEDETEKRQQALGLYHGPFLPDEPDEPWADWPRKRFQAQYLRLLEQELEADRLPEHPLAARLLLEKACQVEQVVRHLFNKFSGSPSTANKSHQG